MDGIRGQVRQKRLVAVLFDEGNGFAGQTVGERLAAGAVGQFRIDPWGVVSAHRTAGAPSALVDVESAVFRPEPFVAQVPLAGEEGGVSGLLEGLCQGTVVLGHVPGIIGHRKFDAPAFRERLARIRADVVGDAVPWRIDAQHDARARGTAHLAGRISLRESHAAAGKRVDMGRLVERTAFNADILDSVVVNQNE